MELYWFIWAGEFALNILKEHILFLLDLWSWTEEEICSALKQI